MRSARLLLAACVMATCLGVSFAQDRPAGEIRIEFAGSAGAPIVLAPGALSAYPVIEQEVSFTTSKGEEKAHYKGVLLWAVLQGWAGALDGHHEELRHTFVVAGSDGYEIAFSFGEIAPDFGDRAIMLATEADGKPLPDGQAFRLVVPGDARGARSVKDVVSIKVR